MAKSDNLRAAKAAKNDEFYTSLDSVNAELYNYVTDRDDLGLVNQFRGKTVFCNCDDPEWSAFWEYFVMNFHSIGLKKLISTHYEPDGSASYKLEWSGETLKDNMVNLIRTPLTGNGDFRSPECIEILKEADIVVTNPPFSLFREYIAQLLEHNKKFVILGSINCMAYKEVFPMMQSNKVWCGYGFNKTMEFIMPDNYVLKGKAYIGEDGRKHGFVPGICWYTNLNVKYHRSFLPVCDYYYGNEERYPKYANFDAINVNAIDDIPCDYEGIMGVPITIFQRLNPDQFEVIGLGNGYLGQSIGIGGIPKEHKKLMKGHSAAGDLYMLINGQPKVPYNRVLIRNKHPKKKKGVS